MSVYGRLKKNAENFIIQDVYKNMTPEQYKKAIEMAVNRTKNELAKSFQIKYNKLVDEFNKNLQDGMATAIDTISVELLHELAVQMNAFNCEDEEIQKQIIDKVQEIYQNTMNSIKKYANYKNDNQATREFKKKKNKVEKMFNLKF